MSKKIKRTRKWHKKLTMAEMRHLEWAGDTLAALRRNFKAQKEQGIRCWDCESIARKLEMENDNG